MENGNKRSREDFDESSSSTEESKRIRPEVLIDIFDDDDDDDVSSAVDCLADVMKSLEEEISSPAPPPVAGPQPDLGYLLEATDDDLGLPPTVGSGTPESDGGEAVEVADDRIWGFEDEISVGYEYFGFGGPLVQEDIGFGFDEGFNDYSDEYEELLWRPEPQPIL